MLQLVDCLILNNFHNKNTIKLTKCKYLFVHLFNILTKLPILVLSNFK